MRDILIIAHFTQAPNEKGNGRFHYLAEKLSDANTKVELVTTDFSHRTKKSRQLTKEELIAIPYTFTMISEPPYEKNVSLNRFYSHYIFGRNLKNYLQHRKRPDVIYCSVPSLDAAKVAAEYARANHVKFIIDVQDLWPEAFEMIFDKGLLSKAIYYPMKKKADFIYAAADAIIGVSDTYSSRALRVNEKCDTAHIVFLGTDLEHFDKLAQEFKVLSKPDEELWVAYIGTLGHSYDIKVVIDALKLLKDRGISGIRFIVMGDGPLKETFETYAEEKGVETDFRGRLDYGQMVGILNECDIAVNPITRGAAQSIINKHSDYAAAGLPVLNTQESMEYRYLVEKYDMGFNCNNNDPQDLAVKLIQLSTNELLRRSMGKNSRRLAEERFDRRIIYEELVDIINLHCRQPENQQTLLEQGDNP
ncbi:glycosyltransferase family 4 protein [Sporosarcina aquimarina]|uniref:Glycosyltransferase family 4 protein n=1 Tax=Sporosarcina aquimarina TaxID=114975 RepID=A0ABU4G154_9BACL|nr:glycosyltransferase family 4 protein [Sporosarcina aquimarina]MDW0110673.1 glycosyltransferase family 4 protein [Sporosarcina aquimarina]